MKGRDVSSGLPVQKRTSHLWPHADRDGRRAQRVLPSIPAEGGAGGWQSSPDRLPSVAAAVCVPVTTSTVHVGFHFLS